MNPILAAARAAALILEDADHRGLPQPLMMTAGDCTYVAFEFMNLSEVTEWALAYGLSITGERITTRGTKIMTARGDALDYPIACHVTVVAEVINSELLGGVS